MKFFRLQLRIFALIALLFLVTPAFIVQPTLNSNKSTHFSQESKLTIYTYESLMNDPVFDIEGNFSLFSNISKENIQITRFDDANELVARLIAEKDSPVADVVIGIDNALIHSMDKTTLLEKYQPSPYFELNPSLIKNLDPDGYLWPYDYGLISLFYQNQVVNASTNPVLSNLTLDTLLHSNLIGQLITENPKLSSPGLGFLLWTIAVYGDPQINFNGLLGGDWRQFWSEARNKINITKSWGDAFIVFFNEQENKPLMVSYGTSPAYGFCLWGDESTSAVVTHENNSTNAWQQIEGIGLVKNSPHSFEGRKFIDWFLSSPLQSNIPTSQWMYPANTKATIPECFTNASINPDEVSTLNSILTPEILKGNIKIWQDQWEIVIVNRNSINGFELTSLPFFFVIAISIIRRRRGNSHR